MCAPVLRAVSARDVKLLECVGEGSYGQVRACVPARGCQGARLALSVRTLLALLSPSECLPLTSPALPPAHQVWTAKFYGSVVCLKVFRSGEAGVVLDELRREAALMASLRHPNGAPLGAWFAGGLGRGLVACWQ